MKRLMERAAMQLIQKGAQKVHSLFVELPCASIYLKLSETQKEYCRPALLQGKHRYSSRFAVSSDLVVTILKIKSN